MDVAFQQDEKKGGNGVVVRDETSVCLVAFARSLAPINSASHVEIEACRDVLLIANYQGWPNVEHESNCSMVVVALNDHRENCYEVGRIMEDCMEYMKSLVAPHVYCEANRVAHTTFIRGFIIDNFWLVETFTLSLIMFYMRIIVMMLEVLALCPL